MRRCATNDEARLGREEKAGKARQLHYPFQRWDGPGFQGDPAGQSDGEAGVFVHGSRLRGEGKTLLFSLCERLLSFQGIIAGVQTRL